MAGSRLTLLLEHRLNAFSNVADNDRVKTSSLVILCSEEVRSAVKPFSSYQARFRSQPWR
jgi:hypothetical protein